MSQAFYRKYRSKSLAEIVGQEHITTALSSALKLGKISHAYLFTGPRGVGKTSIARIMAFEVNNIPYEDGNLPLDIIEIDAASNRRIDEIRDLRDKVHIAPAYAKYKVYIIDEVHMLTKEAFNALLKTLEEPPAHVIFILATTEVHKLPETIVSRTQRFSFKPVASDKVIAHLESLATQEGIQIDNEALQLIAAHGEGSFRDSISLLDQASNIDGAITLDSVRSLLGIAPPEAIDTLLQILQTGSPKELLQTLQTLRNQGLHAAAIARQLGTNVRARIIDTDLPIPLIDATRLLEELLSVAAAHDSDRKLEIVLLNSQFSLSGASRVSHPTAVAASTAPPTPVTKKAVAAQKPPHTEVAAKPTPPATPLKTIETTKPPDAAESNESNESPAYSESTKGMPANQALLALWQEALVSLKKTHNTLHSILSSAEPRLGEEGNIIVAFKFAFHQKRIDDAKNKQVVTDILSAIKQQPVGISCVVDKGATAGPTPNAMPSLASSSQPAPLGAIANIFGGAEVIEA